jgi:hypothetical protein
VIEEYHLSKMEDSLKEHKVDPLETVDRLQMAGKEYGKRRAYLKKKVRID